MATTNTPRKARAKVAPTRPRSRSRAPQTTRDAPYFDRELRAEDLTTEALAARRARKDIA